MNDDVFHRIAHALSELVARREDQALCAQLCRIEDKLDALSVNQSKIMSDLTDLIEVASDLSTKADALSVAVDRVQASVTTEHTAIDAALAALKNVTTLPPEAVAAIAKLKAARDTVAANVTKAAAAGDALDAEVVNLDKELPTPAPAAPPV